MKDWGGVGHPSFLLKLPRLDLRQEKKEPTATPVRGLFFGVVLNFLLQALFPGARFAEVVGYENAQNVPLCSRKAAPNCRFGERVSSICRQGSTGYHWFHFN